jgi:hypothetical protein
VRFSPETGKITVDLLAVVQREHVHDRLAA